MSLRMSARPSSSVCAVKCVTPDLLACTLAPPSSSCVTTSPSTVFTTLGPVRNMYAVPSIMMVKSVRAGEYTAPPAHGPKIPEICGITPDAMMLRWKISAYPARALMPSWMRAPPLSLMPMSGAPTFMAISITLHIFCAIVSESEPPVTVKSCAKTYTRRPSMVPLPTTTPSPRYCFFSWPKLVHLWVTNMSISSKLPLSSSISIRSRAVYLPRSCCFSIAFSPPPRRAFSRRATSSLIFSNCLLIISVFVYYGISLVII